MYPWKALSTWAPFEIDALGLLTLLGANEVDMAVGRLAPSYWLEYMPLLAGFVFAGSRFRGKQPAFTLYNISSGIVTGNLAAWFTRWMQVQEFEVSRSIVYWEVAKVTAARRRWKYFIVPAVISVLFNGLLIAITMLSRDWYGFANALSIIFLIGARSYMIQASRDAINRAVAAARPLPSTFTGAVEEWEKKYGQKRQKAPAKGSPSSPITAPRPRLGSKQWRPDVAKILVTMPDSKAVTMFIPEHLLRGVFVTETAILSPGLYRLAQWFGWTVFTVHVVTLGMAHLATQLYIIALTVIPTVLTCYGFGCDDSRIYAWWRGLWDKDVRQPYIHWAGAELKATVFEWPMDVEFSKDETGKIHRRKRDGAVVPRGKRSTARMDLYAWLNLSDEEQRSLWDWHLLPHQRGHDDTWWNDFEDKKSLIRENAPDIHAVKNCIQRDMEAARARRGRWTLYSRPRDGKDIEKGYAP